MELFIVATPIGNLEDITLRALNTLKEADVIICEDTRHSGILLKKYEIEKKLLSYHAHSGHMKIEKIIDLLKEGKKCALISDAGTPGISDPAYSVIKRALEEGIKVTPIPGATALLTALSASGLPMDKFIYLGFLPTKKGRQTIFESMVDEKRTTIFYESPHRIQKTIKSLADILDPDRKIVIARELTKIHEEFMRGTIQQIKEECEKRTLKGEIVVLIAGKKVK